MEVLSRSPSAEETDNRKLEMALSRYGQRFGERRLRKLVQEARAIAAFQEGKEKVEETVRSIRASAATKSVVSLYLPLYDDGDGSLLDSLAAEMESAEDLLFRKQVLNLARDFLSSLPGKEAKILALRLGIDCEPCSQQVVADYLGTRKERVFQIEKVLSRRFRQFLLNRKAI